MPPRSASSPVAPSTSLALAALLALAAGSSACAEGSIFGADKFCGDTRTAPKVYYGTLLPSLVPLTPEQLLSVGSFRLCSGTLIAPTWVLTAQHCGLAVGANFCMGDSPSDPDVCIRSSAVYNHPDADITLVELSADARGAVPGVVPLPYMDESLGQEWIGRRAEAAGYGQTETGALGTRYFTAEPIVALDSGFATIDGEGQRGVCFGDSGGPLLIIADDGTVRVAGVLSNGDDTCVGRDNFTRADSYRDWIAKYAGEPQLGEGDQSCVQLGRVGRCETERAVWCGNERVQTEVCAAGTACGWDAGDGGFRCIAGEDPCGGVDAVGTCDGEIARWCDNGVPQARDCGVCGEICLPSVNGVGAYCVPDNCNGLDYLGQCEGDVVVWCDAGQRLERDCAALGQVCKLIDEQIGFYCADP
ncbi:S1 family peptidase [Haliangium ochraceum]|uniref:Peptidase S1 and S6 chymotrypsin/Hap n=1 Tax=Haliangium ochraceum (strain DSM 14365 / JCM 11303 / SMP-2) TaxID=502025 RepID=D0LGF1_HALO1|nr:trypsin-like serine protease [Haliangium ochraceum]ACY12697.1 peptidase S1 and S6 chymotrypsin/Hap [Haliangium ochraceum DSM 14365]